jgi:thiamine transport system ATP-binding protein
VIISSQFGALRPADRVPPYRRAVNTVFQDYALFPHRDVFGNVAFGLRMRGETPDVIESRTAELLALVGLAGLEGRSVATLSGGEQQRVALARALAPEPRVLLLDEPLGSLDRRLRDRLLDDLERLFAELAVTAVYITHDQTEAFTLGDRVAVMRDGQVVQVETPDGLWAHPLDEDVARFLGLANVVDDEIVRPEAVRVRPATGDGQGVVERVVRVGPVVRLRVRLDDRRTLEAAVAALAHPRAGDRVDVEIDPEGIVRLL